MSPLRLWGIVIAVAAIFDMVCWLGIGAYLLWRRRGNVRS
jgi:hypothetical protein